MSGALYGELYAASVVTGMRMAQTGDRDDIHSSVGSRQYAVGSTQKDRSSAYCLLTKGQENRVVDRDIDFTDTVEA